MVEPVRQGGVGTPQGETPPRYAWRDTADLQGDKIDILPMLRRPREMNVHTLTPADRNYLFSLICYGRATPANMARALGIDRRTARRLTDDDHLADIIPNPAKGDIGRWYALLDTKSHAWSTTDGCHHFEAITAAILRDNLAARVLEAVGDALKQRMIEECPNPTFHVRP